ncbi:hypothetical protein LAZ67_8001243 [Cordylochernes scorpioides]|uniref:Integrase catalytic domain-containing protein n=1 Tax=Cordylochernes scorpioides TaxID=51811 RepID=A0ABY6KTN5_9ARAC|nr:hypothetical protein LAZ67_8001243 [Cordylochernes scorpioides]
MVVGSKAHRLVTSFPLTEKNYNQVIEDLKDRFGDRDMLTELYVRKLLKLVIARSEKRTLAQLYDDLVAHLHSLGSLGVDTKSGGGAFLYPLVESSLPLELIKIWQRSRTPFKEREDYSEIEAGIEHSGAKAFDKLEGLIEFLKQEVKNAECLSFVAKTRVAPLKSITIPRLELVACLLSARLTTSIVRALIARPIKTIFWSDSSTALSWISTKHKWSIFVSNRVNEIRSSTNIDDWRFVPGTLNPADLPSRGCYAPQLILSKWWEGPQWLRESEDKWPKQKPIPNEEQVLEEKKGTVVQNTIVQNRKFWYSPEEFRKPVLLPCDHPITEQLIRETHSNNCHAGVHFLLSKLREKFWILKARKTIKRVVRGCIICRRHAEKANTIPCAPLPKDRLFMGRPFEVTGVDLMGSLYLKNDQKIWITLFTCAVYRAVHLELVEGLDATNFIMALERFIHRRGRPVKIYSDNGTNFKRTNRLFTNLNWDKIAKYSCDKQIRWIFIPPSAPWWGGWWERLVRLVKDFLRRTLGTNRVIYVQLETLICHVEAIINTRPLTYISETEDDLIPITPQMFIQKNFGSFDESHELSPDNTRQHFRKLQQIKKGLKERFHKEYLAMLVQKGNETEGRRFFPGKVVLIGRDDQKRIFWPLGRILELYPGKDARERVARVRTASGEFVRPLKILFSLKLGSDISREVRLPKTEGIKAQEIPTDGEQSIFTRSGREVKKPTRLGVYTNNLS